MGLQINNSFAGLANTRRRPLQEDKHFNLASQNTRLRAQ
jgi:hypothetical protein